MKTRNITVLILLICFQLSHSIYAQKWDYPVKPGTKEWRELKNQIEKVNICQIPDSILITISTEDLFELCINYPLIPNIMAFNFAQDGINSYKSNFNGINELFQRKDFHKILIKRYSDSKPLGFDKSQPKYKKGEYAWKITVLELFLAQDEIISKLNSKEKKDILKILNSKKAEKLLDEEVYGRNSIMSIYFPMAKILLSENQSLTKEKESKLKKFSESGDLNDLSIVSDIEELLIDYDKN